MDILGKKGEEAVDEVHTVEERVANLESHLDAVDSALQDFVDNYQAVLEDELNYQEEELERLRSLVRKEKEPDDEYDSLKRKLERLERKQKNIQENTEDQLSQVVKMLRTASSEISKTRGEIDRLEERIDELENRLMVHRNNSDYDFSKKLDKKKHEEEKKELKSELSRVKTAVRMLADEMDSDNEVRFE